MVCILSEMANTSLKFGVQTVPQNTTWQELLSAWKAIDSLGFDSAWVFDHFVPIFSDPSGPCLEGWTLLSALSQHTTRVKVGVMVTGNTYRHPAVLAKQACTVDHASGGRLVFGIGAAWFEMEHNAYGIPFYTVGERIRRLDEALEVIKKLWRDERVSFSGKYYQIQDAPCEPKPLQKPHPPIMIGGGGEKLMLKVVAKHAQQWNAFGTPAEFKRKIEILDRHAKTFGRSADQIEKSVLMTTLVTEDKMEADALIASFASMVKIDKINAEERMLVGHPGKIVERIRSYVNAGVTTFILSVYPPFHLKSLELFASKVMPCFKP